MENSDHKNPLFINPLLEQLYSNSFLIDQRIIKEILDLPKETLIPDLKTVLIDSIKRYEYFKNDVEWTDETHTFILHALFLLKELSAEDALEDVLGLLRQNEEFLDFWFDELLTLEIWKILFELGKNQLDVLKNFIIESNNYLFARTEIAAAVSQIAIHFPERRAEVINWFAEVFKEFVMAKKNNELIDFELVELMICNLIEMNAVELEPVIKILYEEEIFTEDMVGEMQELLDDLNDRQNEFDIHEIKDIYSSYNKLKRFVEPPKKQRNYLNNKFDIRSREVIEEKPKLFSNLNVGRNDKCPCGSGLKYKKCHGK